MFFWPCTMNWALWTSYVILKRVPAHERKSISRNLFISGPMLMGIFCLFWGGEYPGKVCDIGFGTPCIVECEVHMLVFINYWIEKCTVKHWKMYIGHYFALSLLFFRSSACQKKSPLPSQCPLCIVCNSLYIVGHRISVFVLVISSLVWCSSSTLIVLIELHQQYWGFRVLHSHSQSFILPQAVLYTCFPRSLFVISVGGMLSQYTYVVVLCCVVLAHYTNCSLSP